MALRPAPQTRSLLHPLCQAHEPVILPGTRQECHPKREHHTRGACLCEVESPTADSCSFGGADLAGLQSDLSLFENIRKKIQVNNYVIKLETMSNDFIGSEGCEVTAAWQNDQREREARYSWERQGRMRRTLGGRDHSSVSMFAHGVSMLQ